MKQILFTVLMMVSIGVEAQNAVLSGRLLTNEKSTEQASLINEQLGINLPVKIGADRTFKITVPNITKGFYNLSAVGLVYLEPGYKLKLAPRTDSAYSFTGKGSEENRILAQVEQAKKILPLTDGQIMFTWKVLSDPIDTMLNAITTYQAAALNIIAASKNENFRRLAEAHAHYFALNLLPLFKGRYGLDGERYEKSVLLSKTLDAKDPFYLQRVQRAQVLSVKKIIRGFEVKQVDSVYTANFDWNNELVFNNSTEYQKAIIGQLQLFASAQTADKEAIKKAAVAEAKKRITVPKMLEYVITNYENGNQLK